MSPPLPLLLLHGFTGGGAAWRPVIDQLRARHPRVTVRTPDLLGHGQPAAGKRTRSFEGETARIAEHVHQLATTTGHPVHLAGYSLGARVALGVLVEHGLTSELGAGLGDSSCEQDLARVTLIGVHPGLPEGKEGETQRQERRAADRRWVELLQKEGLDAFLDAWEALPLFASQQQLPTEIREAQRHCRRRHSAEGLARSLEILGLAEMPDYGRRLAEHTAESTAEHIAEPGRTRPHLTLIAGGEDAKFSALARTLADRLAATSEATLEASSEATRPPVHLLPGVGHNPLLEDPATVADLLTTPPEEMHP